jgi:hypothetical protein
VTVGVSVGVRVGTGVRVDVAVLVGILVLVGFFDAVAVKRGVLVGGDVGDTGRLVFVAGACILAGLAVVSDVAVSMSSTIRRRTRRFITRFGLDSRHSFGTGAWNKSLVGGKGGLAKRPAIIPLKNRFGDKDCQSARRT